MKAKKAKTFLLGISALAGVALTSCGKEQSSKQESRVPQKQEQKFDVEKARKEYKEHCADSIRVANGYNDMRAQQRQISDSIYAVEAQKGTIEWESSLGGAIQAAVESSGNKILDGFFQELDALLGKYKISLKSHFHGEDDMYWEFYNNDEYDGVSYIYKSDLIYTGVVVDDEDFDYSEEQYEKLIKNIGNIVEESQYGQQRKDEIMAAVRKLINQTKKKLITSRKATEAKFSDYYVAMDDEDLAFQYGGEGDTDYGYEHLNHGRDILAKTKHIHVYDSKLPVEFFGDEGAEYKLVSLGNNKWYVQKKTASGKIEKTAVFTDAGKVAESTYCYGKEWFDPSYSFSYTPGDNMGVHIETRETTVLKTAKKQWTCPQTVANELKYLEQQQATLSGQNISLWNKMDSVSHYADSVANVMATMKYPKVR